MADIAASELERILAALTLDAVTVAEGSAQPSTPGLRLHRIEETEVRSDPWIVPLRNGPVAVAISATIAGAERKLPHAKSYEPPIPEEWAKVADKSSKPVPDGILEILWPEKQ